jgi:hypothetical protein
MIQPEEPRLCALEDFARAKWVKECGGGGLCQNIPLIPKRLVERVSNMRKCCRNGMYFHRLLPPTPINKTS